MANPMNNGNVSDRITRRQFIRRAGVVGGAVAAAGLGLSGAARAHLPSQGEKTNIRNAMLVGGQWVDAGDPTPGAPGYLVYPTGLTGVPASYATGTIPPPDPAAIADGQTFSIDDGLRTAVYEFNRFPGAICDTLLPADLTSIQNNDRFFISDDGSPGRTLRFEFNMQKAPFTPTPGYIEVKVYWAPSGFTDKPLVAKAMAAAINAAKGTVYSKGQCFDTPSKISAPFSVPDDATAIRLSHDIHGEVGNNATCTPIHKPSDPVPEPVHFIGGSGIPSPGRIPINMSFAEPMTKILVGGAIQDAIGFSLSNTYYGCTSGFKVVATGIQTNPPTGMVLLRYATIGSSGNNVVITGIQSTWAPGRDADPHSDQGHIQWAVDNVAPGGTVVLKATAAGTDTLTPFDLGTGMVRITRDVAVIGEPPVNVPADASHPTGRAWRTKVINGGNHQFAAPSNQPGKSVTIRDIEFFRPGSGTGSVGATSVFITNSTGTEISGCKFTVDGTSIAQFLYIKFGIWIIFRPDMAANPATGPLIVRDNEFLVRGRNMSGGSAAVGFGNFFDQGVPSLLVDNNYVEADGCHGAYGAALGTAHGNGSNATFSNNTVKTVGEPSDRALSFIPSGGTGPFNTANVQVLRNDFSETTAKYAQVVVDGPTLSDSLFSNNDYGPVVLSTAPAGFIMKGHGNFLVNENFPGNYPGLPGVPCLWMTSQSYGNTVTALKNGQNLQGMDLCYQILNEGDNTVPGYERCGAVPPDVKTKMRMKECLALGGVWDGATCTLPPALSMEDIPIPQD